MGGDLKPAMKPYPRVRPFVLVSVNSERLFLVPGKPVYRTYTESTPHAYSQEVRDYELVAGHVQLRVWQHTRSERILGVERISNTFTESVAPIDPLMDREPCWGAPFRFSTETTYP